MVGTGAVPADLSEPLSVDWQENFDIVTNAGTTEHVEPLKAQYQCFKNIHESLKVGGVAVHMVPDARALERDGSWGGHCRTYYRSEFFEMLAEYHRYRIVRSKRVNGLCCVGLVKTVSGRFMDETPQFYTQLLFKAQGPQVVWKIYYGVRRMLKIGTFS
jgi:hypothetical protein